jgi:putative membrane protein
MSNSQTPDPFKPEEISRPHPVLLKYYALVALLAGPLFPFAFLPLLFKYETLKYRFDGSGIAMSWGLLFKKEIHLTYRRIQDIHLTRNLVQRWLGLATVGIQTASGNSGPEMSIEGILAADRLRDFLYTQMRGARSDGRDGREESSEGRGVGDEAAGADEALVLLRNIRDALQRAAGQAGGGS